MRDFSAGSRWKHKYQELIQEQEESATQWQKKLDNLQRGLAKVSVAAHGQDTTLDAALKKLREALRKDKGVSGLAREIEALELGMHAMDKSRIKRTQESAESLSRLLQQLQSIDIDRSASRAINKLERQLKQAAQRSVESFDIELWLEQIVAAQAKALSSLPVSSMSAPPISAPPVQAEAGETPGLLQRLFGSRDELDDPQSLADGAEDQSTQVLTPELGAHPTADVLEENTAEQFEIDTSGSNEQSQPGNAARSDSTAVNDAYDSVRVEVVAVLLGLLADIEVPPDAQAVANQLYEDLQNGLDWSELVPALDSVVTVVTAALGRDQQEFEQFLQSLNQQLLEIGSFISFVDHSQLISAEQSDTFGLELGQQLKEIKAGFVSFAAGPQGDISELKRSVNGNLENIVLSLERFQQDQTEQQLSMTQQLAEMTARIENMEAEARQAAENLQKQREKLLRDTLTNLPNREAYNIRLQQEFDRWQRYQRPLVFAIADVDFFKRINDGYGHAAGDKVLKIIAKTLSKQLRKTDFIARFGGEEFVMILPETDLKAAELALEKLRAAIEACPFRFRDKPLTITSSFGATQFAAGDTLATVFDRADKALYKAKESGRNRFHTVVKEPSANEEPSANKEPSAKNQPSAKK